MSGRFQRFHPAEREKIAEALKSHLALIDSFLSDADGDDVESVREDRRMVVNLTAELGRAS